MKKIYTITTTLVLSCFLLMSFVLNNDVELADEIKWYTWEEAIELNEENPKKLFVDVYTDWCGWCKKMDKSTFQDEDIVKYMNDNFYPIKLNAEQKEDIVYKGHTFKFVPNGRRGYHELAASLLDNRLSFPSFVALNEEQARITIIPGFMDANSLQPVLEFINDEKYSTMSYEEYLKERDGGE